MKKIACCLILCFVLLALYGCNRWTGYRITSEPIEANVIVGSNYHSKTPTEVYLYKQDEQFIMVKKEGYKDASSRVKPQLMNDYIKMHFGLEKLKEKVAGEVLIEVIETSQGMEIHSRDVHAELDVIERSPNVTAVQRVTDLSSNRWIGHYTLSKDSANLFIEILDEENVDGKKNRYSNLWSLNPSGGGGIRRVTQGNCFDRHPYISDNSEVLYFSSNRTGRYSIWSLSLRTMGGLRLVTSGATSDSYPVLSPNGNEILYTAYVIGSSIPQLWSTPIGRGLPTQFREGQNGQWSKDGKKILFTTQNRTTGVENIWIMSADGSSPTQLTYSSQYNDIHPRWSPDGTKIAFSSDRGQSGGKNNYDIWIMNADGSDPRQLTTNGSRDDSPVFSADGKSIYFRSNRGIKWDIWVMKILE